MSAKIGYWLGNVATGGLSGFLSHIIRNRKQRDSGQRSAFGEMIDRIKGEFTPGKGKAGDFFQNVWNGVSKLGDNLGRRYLGTGLTAAEREANEWSANQAQIARDENRDLSNTAYQRAVTDMSRSGVNPALMYGSGANGASTPSSPSASSVSPQTSMADLFTLLMLPSQLKNLNAQTDSIRQGVLESRQRIEESKSRVRYQNLLSDYYPQLTDAQIREIDAAVKEKLSNVVVNDKRASNLDADTALKNVHRSLARIQEKYADEYNSLQNAVLGAKSEEARANAALAYTRKAMDDLEKKYMEDYSMKMGTNEYLGLAVSLCSLFGANAKELVGTITDGIKEHMRELGEAISKGGNPHPGT